MKQFTTAIDTHERIAHDFYRLVLEWPEELDQPRPGQFIDIRIQSVSVPLLRRPFAISNFDSTRRCAEILYQKKGTATGLLAQKHPNDKLDILGPLGRGFTLQTNAAVLLAGGTGLGPMRYLHQWLLRNNIEATLVAGFTDKSRLPGTLFEKSDPVALCTDNGSDGFRGTPIDYCAQHSIAWAADTRVYACGPWPLLHGAHEFALKNGYECEVGVEQIMACGVGACMGCTIQVRRYPGYARVCTEGPVFDSREIVWT